SERDAHLLAVRSLPQAFRLCTGLRTLRARLADKDRYRHAAGRSPGDLLVAARHALVAARCRAAVANVRSRRRRWCVYRLGRTTPDRRTRRRLRNERFAAGTLGRPRALV